MIRLLHKAAEACYLQGLIDEGIKQKYVLSGRLDHLSHLLHSSIKNDKRTTNVI